MKLEDKIKETIARRGNPTATPTKAGPSSSKVQWLVGFALVTLAGAGTYAILYYFVLTRIPHAMVGAWVVMEVKTKGEGKGDESLKGGTLEFRRDGTMIGKVNMGGKEGKIKATVEVEGETLRITSVNPNDGQAMTDVQMIRTLEGDRLVIEDRKGTVLMLERLRE